MAEVRSQNDRWTFVPFGWVHLPTILFFPQAKLTGLFGQHHSLHHFNFYCTCVCLALVPPPNWYWKWGEGFFLFNYLAKFSYAWSKNLPAATILADRGDTPALWLTVFSNRSVLVVRQCLIVTAMMLECVCVCVKLCLYFCCKVQNPWVKYA